jgi:hypothetical protein
VLFLALILRNKLKIDRSIAKNNEFPIPWGFINLQGQSKQGQGNSMGSRLIAQGEFMGEK